MIATSTRKRPRRLARHAMTLSPSTPAPSLESPIAATDGHSATGLRRVSKSASVAVVVAARAMWHLGRPARIIMLAVATALVLVVCWYIVLPVVAAVVSALFYVMAVLVGFGLSLKAVGWVLGAAPVKAAALQVGMTLLVCWFASLVAASWATYRVTCRRGT